MQVGVEVGAQRFAIPYECPCCGTAPNAETPVLAKQTGPTQLFPYCTRCVDHARDWDNANVTSTATMLLGIVAAALVTMMTGPLQGVVVFVLSTATAWWLRVWRRKTAEGMRGPSCASAAIAVTYQGYLDGRHAFLFDSPTFAARFAEDNKAQLANVSPQLQRLIDGYHRARLAVPTPAVATGHAPPPLSARQWQARLEITEGTLARRNDLERALEMIEEPLARREMITTVAKLELAPIIAGLQRTTSPLAKRRILEHALTEVRTGNLSPELAAAKERELQARLGEL